MRAFGPDPFIGMLFQWIRGLASATNFIPLGGIKRWARDAVVALQRSRANG